MEKNMFHITNFFNAGNAQKVEMASNAVELVHNKLKTVYANALSVAGLFVIGTLASCPYGSEMNQMCSNDVIKLMIEGSSVFCFASSMYIGIHFLEVFANRGLRHYNATDVQKSYANIIFGIGKVCFAAQLAFMGFLFANEALKNLGKTLEMKVSYIQSQKILFGEE